MTVPISYWQRHIGSFIRYGTFNKFKNLLNAYTAYVLKKEKVTSMPAFLKVETCRYCDVNCRYCYLEKSYILYPFELYTKLIDQFKDYIYIVSLYDIGEPLHNPKIIDYIKYANQNKVGTVISSSLSIEKDDVYWVDLVNSGLDTLVVAIDGITPEVYNYYRRGGRFELVMSNLEKLIKARNNEKSRLSIEWQMIDFSWNRKEQIKARKIANQLGCDTFRIIYESIKKRIGYDTENNLRRRNCLLPYVLFFVTASNDVRLCYKIYHHDMYIGSLSSNSFSEIWNGSEIARVRNNKKIIHREGCRICSE